MLGTTSKGLFVGFYLLAATEIESIGLCLVRIYWSEAAFARGHTTSNAEDTACELEWKYEI